MEKDLIGTATWGTQFSLIHADCGELRGTQEGIIARACERASL